MMVQHDGQCSFCGKLAGDRAPLATISESTATAGRICKTCVDLCIRILDGTDVDSTDIDLRQASSRVSKEDEVLHEQIYRAATTRTPIAPELLERVPTTHCAARAASKSFDFRCSLCLKPADAVSRLISGPGVFICEPCTVAAAKVLS
jgi:ATP-dependent protease Clp ATPase subunit